MSTYFFRSEKNNWRQKPLSLVVASELVKVFQKRTRSILLPYCPFKNRFSRFTTKIIIRNNIIFIPAEKCQSFVEQKHWSFGVSDWPMDMITLKLKIWQLRGAMDSAFVRLYIKCVPIWCKYNTYTIKITWIDI